MIPVIIDTESIPDKVGYPFCRPQIGFPPMGERPLKDHSLELSFHVGIKTLGATTGAMRFEGGSSFLFILLPPIMNIPSRYPQLPRNFSLRFPLLNLPDCRSSSFRSLNPIEFLFCWYFSFHNAKIIAHGFTFVKLFMRKSVILLILGIRRNVV